MGPTDQTSPEETSLDELLVTERELWIDGPPHETFKRLRSECPVHWTSEITEFPHSAGYWSVTAADDVLAVSRDWETYSSELGGITAVTEVFPLELMRAMFIGMDPPKHDRIKALFQMGFTPKRIAAHEKAIREITVAALDRLEGREACDLVKDVAQPVVARVIGSFMGISPEDDVVWAELMNSTLGASDPDLNPRGAASPEDIEAAATAAGTRAPVSTGFFESAPYPPRSAERSRAGGLWRVHPRAGPSSRLPKSTGTGSRATARTIPPRPHPE